MTSILDPIEHQRLLADLENVCEVANVPRTYVHQSMAQHCGAAEIEWVRNFRQNRIDGVGGLCLTGPNGETRAMAICGALLRNFIDARIVSVNQLIAAGVTGNSKPVEIPDPSVLIVPNLYVSTHGKAMTSWQIQSLYDTFLGRLTANRPSVVYIESMSGLADAYGAVFAEHLIKHFTQA